MPELLGIAPLLKILFSRASLQTVIGDDTLLLEKAKTTSMHNSCLPNEVITSLITSSSVERQTEFLGTHEIVSYEDLLLLLLVIIVPATTAPATMRK